VAVRFAKAVVRRATRKRVPLTQLLGIYLFAAFIGVLGGRIVAAATFCSDRGWTAMWVEVGTWGPVTPRETNSGDYRPPFL
jgi:hypothetical protein